jgi:4-hydroxy-tetrahydrodipicolinate synthase
VGFVRRPASNSALKRARLIHGEIMPIAGINVAAVTPHRKGREIDLAGSLDLIDYLCDAGVKGIALLGSTGEFLRFRFTDRVRLLNMAVKRSRLPIIAGVADAAFDGTLELARAAIDAGSAALLVMPPYFFPYTQAQVKEFYLRLRAELNGAVPLLLYNIPFFTTRIDVETSLELLETGQFAGIKDSSGSFEAFERFKALRERVPITVLVGNDIIFTRARRAGADGGVSGCACAIPELMLGLDCAIRDNAEERIARLEQMLKDFIGWLDRFPVPVGIKEATMVRGLKVGPPAVPLPAAEERLLAEYREWFSGFLKAVQREVSPR